MRKLTKILVPIDFSGPSDQVLAEAGDLATAQSAKVELVHIVPTTVYPALYDTYLPQSAYDREGLMKDVSEELDTWAKRLRDRGLEVQTHVGHGLVAESIVRLAKEVEADLVVIATRGRTGLPHALLGSVTERVVRLAACPVLTINTRHAEAKTEEESAAAVSAV